MLAVARRIVAADMLGDWGSLFSNTGYAGANFLPLLGENGKPFMPTHLNLGPWLRLVGKSSSLTARLAWAVLDHAPIGAYRRRFKLSDMHRCKCSLLETHAHVLSCPIWQLSPRPSAKGINSLEFVSFLEENPVAFSFAEGPRCPPALCAAQFFRRVFDPGGLPRRLTCGASSFIIQEVCQDLLDDANLLFWYL